MTGVDLLEEWLREKNAHFCRMPSGDLRDYILLTRGIQLGVDKRDGTVYMGALDRRIGSLYDPKFFDWLGQLI